MQWIVLLLVLLGGSAYAQVFQIQVTDYDGLDQIGPIKNFIDSELLKVQDQVNEDIPNGSASRIMKGMANSSVLAGNVVAADYASHMKVYLLGTSLGAAVDTEKESGTNSDISGFGVATGLMAGMNVSHMGLTNFAGLDTKRLNFYLNYMDYGYGTSLNDKINYDSEATISSNTIGFRFNYLLNTGKEYRYATWGGVNVHWGYFYNKSSFTFQADVDKTVDLYNGDQRFNGRLVGTPKFDVDVETHSFPFEISSDISFFKFLTLFGGAGVDFNLGKARGSGNADVTATPLICTDGGSVCGGGKNLQMKINATANASNWVDPIAGRVFVGAQINVPYVQLYGQLNKAVGTKLYGAAVGLRFVY